MNFKRIKIFNKRKAGLLFFFLFLLFFINISSAEFYKGNKTADIKEYYMAGQSLSGWINISLQDVLFNSKIRAFNSNITLKSLLDLNGFLKNKDYNCSLYSCEYDFFPSSCNLTNNIRLDGEQIILVNLTDSRFSQVDSFFFNATTNAEENCFMPISIDILDDNALEFYAHKYKAGSYCSAENYGCYSSSSSKTLVDSGKNYCQKFNISSAAAILVGADLYGTGNANFSFYILESGFNCISNVSSNKASCLINQSFLNEEATICLSKISGSDYEVYYEDNSSCGFVDEDIDQNRHDFSIFFRPIKYDAPRRIYYSEDGFALSDYIEERYKSDCSKGCFIPIRFSSPNVQNLIIDEFFVKYSSGGISKTANSLCSSEMMASKISSHFLKISLDNSNISVQYDNKKRVNFSLYLDSKEIIKKEIEISPALIITDLDPKTAPLGIAVQFNAIYSGNFSSFLWDFGDNTTIQTNNSKASHAYSSIKPFTLKVTAINNFGNYSKEFTINVTNSKDYINQTLSSYEKYISSLGARISSYPALVKTSLESYLDLDSIKNKVAQSKLKYNSAPNDTQNLLEVIDSLEGINIPFNTSSSRIIFGPTFSNIEFSDAEKFNLISGESFKAEGLKDAVLEWNQKSINLEQEQIEYYMVYKNKSLLAGTYFKLDVIPVSDLDKVYVFIATKQGNNVYSNNNLIEKDGNYGLVLSDLKKDSQINLEIFITGDNSYKEIPFLFFPQSNKLAYSLNYAKCDFDDKCESGETRLNCRNDCMDWQFVSIGLTVLLLIFFIVYIFVQEWYKRRYESWLFRERHDLFNLINFISHAEEKSMKKEVICSMLKKKKWTGEQITFAYKRFKGERTGMWEIPILRRREAREVKEELEIRRNQQNINKPRNS